MLMLTSMLDTPFEILAFAALGMMLGCPATQYFTAFVFGFWSCCESPRSQAAHSLRVRKRFREERPLILRSISAPFAAGRRERAQVVCSIRPF
jgi:hypothetical protein